MAKEVQTFEITEETLDKAYQDVMSDPVYGTNFEILKEAFVKHRENTDERTVAMKIALVDFTHSTQLRRYKDKLTITDLARYIVSIKDFDERVKNGEYTLVEKIAKNGKVKLLSFASKYCQLHNNLVYGRDDYAKYDNVVCSVLPHYTKDVSENYLRNKIRNACDYTGFMKVLDSALANVDVKDKRLKFDYLMWYNNREK